MGDREVVLPLRVCVSDRKIGGSRQLYSINFDTLAPGSAAEHWFTKGRAMCYHINVIIIVNNP